MIKGKYFIQHAALILLLLSVLIGKGQTGKYPQGYFANPLTIPMSLSANFGELRPGHWHMGLDLRTERKENYPVLASADGHIAHVGIRPLSFGKFIIINHPNGYSTLYAHLNEFYPELEKFVRQKQTEKESWAIELSFKENDFKVKSGDEIAKSGNTGGSQGPHLHFEIRDTKSGRSLNPQLFGFNIRDDVPPSIARLAIYDRTVSTYLQTPQMIPVIKTDSGYFAKPRKILTGSKKLSFAITATDRINGSNGANGIYSAYFYYDALPQVAFVIDSINYQESDYINAHVDKRYRNAGGPFVQHLSTLPGFQGSVYKQIDGTGVIELRDTLVHDVSIEVFDADENYSTLFFQVQYSDNVAKKVKYPGKDRLLVPNQVNIVEEKGFEVYMRENCLYDTIPFSYSRQDIFPAGAVTALHRFGDRVYPIHSAFSVRIKAVKPVANYLKNKLVMVKEWKGDRSLRKAEWHPDSYRDGWLSALFDNLGNFQVFVDTIAPTINAPAKTRLPAGQGKDTLNLSPLSRIVFTPKDNYGVRSFRAELDGKWLMFSNDKGKSYVYVFDEQCPYGVHELKVRVDDIVGNVTEKTWWFKKYPYTPPPIKKKKSTLKKKPAVKKK
ncbi:MAG TPA: M23 family metallopeptidase [Chitinophagaceae bacterium]|nr:M23 family metallopeptidase [Chitinophagaceae bacterium]